MTKQKVSEFLSELDSHGIYDAELLAADFKEKTGEKPCWSTFSAKQTAKTMANRGLGGTIKTKDPKKMLAYGYTTAIACASEYVPGFQSTKLGRGSAFGEAIAALQKAGR